MRALELWGGFECTVNRVGGRYFDQVRRTGHHDRVTDLDLIAECGFNTLRYPILWERCCKTFGSLDWSWADVQLNKIQSLKMRPIGGLLHHGSGPAFTNLLDNAFPEHFALFARAAARRYPWIDSWTPINEPMTTARFAGLYGHWFPHLQDERSFWKMLLNQIDATRFAMREIRRECSSARLIQTEDIGYTYSTRAVSAQAVHDNHRRWMTFDLLDGAVTDEHPLAERLQRFGFGDRLKAIADDPSPADVVGINHYITSDRFLDHRLDNYPPHVRGGNGLISFADVEAVRVLQPAPAGLERALRETATRYTRPVAVTEVHNGCNRDEQMRWFVEAWRTALCLREEGLQIEAVTAWALLGGYDWDSLLTLPRNHYESGAFDTRGSVPRATALARMVTTVNACGAAALPPGIPPEGWWRRDVRLQYRPVVMWDIGEETSTAPYLGASERAAPLLICGSTGTLGRALARQCRWRNLPYITISGRALLSGGTDSMRHAIERMAPWAVVNAAGYVRVDDAEADADACFEVNAHGAIRLADVCGRLGLPLVSFSSDLVFDGEKKSPYIESDKRRALNVYGQSKSLAEECMQDRDGAFLLIRTAAFFSPWDSHNFAAHIVRTVAQGRTALAPDNMTVSPTYVPDLANAVLDLLIDGERGIWHLANAGSLTWAEFGKAIVERLDFDPERVAACDGAAIGWTAPRPVYSALGSARGQMLPPLEDAMDRYVEALRKQDFLSEFSQHAAALLPAR